MKIATHRKSKEAGRRGHLAPIDHSGSLTSRLVVVVGLGLSLVCCVDLSALESTRSPHSAGGEFRVGEIDVEALRVRGQAGLDELVSLYESLSAECVEGDVQAAEELKALASKIDEVAAARDSHISGLFWYTDFEQAKVEALKSNRPILSLRMMGKLTDEYSCANSRFFRTALYGNEDIATYLREHYVLHWHSVRPVPRVTIDFGDGRILHRTLTGNSIHYITAPSGEPLDALPGLYSPQLFLQYLQRGRLISEAIAVHPDKGQIVSEIHDSMRRDLLSKWEEQLSLVYKQNPELRNVNEGEDGAVDAVDAMPRAVTKSLVEVRLAEEIVMKRLEDLAAQSDAETWAALATLYREGAALDEQSREIVARHMGCGCEPSDAIRNPNDDLEKKIENFENAIALDTARNEFLMHVELHRWFASGEVSEDLRDLDERAYDELFLTPSSDPWIGLVPEHAYTALEGEGIESGNRNDD